MKSSRIRWTRHVAHMKDKTSSYMFFVGNSGGKRPIARPRRRWEDNIKMDIKEIELDVMD
jgi:hypothetical protein